MAERLIDSITSENVKKWYLKNTKKYFLDDLGQEVFSKGYVFDKKSGFFIKPIFSEETTKKLNQTVIQVIFPRPTDYHYHLDVDETIKTINGEARTLIVAEQSRLTQDSERYIPKNAQHCFCPSKNESLELLIVCSGILDPSKEVCVRSFDSFHFNSV